MIIVPKFIQTICSMKKDQTRESLWFVALISLPWKQITPKIFAL